MGRKTFESIGRILPGRRNIIVSRNRGFHVAGAEVMHSVDEAIGSCQHTDEIFIIGGAALYADAFPRASRLYITEVDVTPEGETLFPDFDKRDWRETGRNRA